MKAFRMGIKSIFRTPARSVLFLMLLTILTAMLTLGTAVLSAITGYLKNCDSFYHSIAELEYVGHDYPDKTVYDEALKASLEENRDVFRTIRELEGCEAFEADSAELGLIDGVVRKDNALYDENAAVLEVSFITYDRASGAYVGIIKECLYSTKDHTGLMVFVSPYGLEPETEFGSLPRPASYVMTGYYFSGTSSYIWFQPSAMTLEIDGKVQELPVFRNTSDGIPEEDPYRRAAALMALRNNGFRVQKVSDLEYYRPYQQEEMKLREGRTFVKEEYQNEEAVCLLSVRAAEYAEAGAGDVIRLAFAKTDGGIYQSTSPEISETEEYRVVGILESPDDDPGLIILPVSDPVKESACPTGYTIGTYHLNNRKAETFYLEAKERLPIGYRLTLYDQGYAKAARPYEEMKQIAQLFLAVTILLILAVLTVYCNLYVIRQKDTARIMTDLGARRAFAAGYFESGAVLIYIPAAILGMMASGILEKRVLRMVDEFAAKTSVTDTRFSSGALSIVRGLEFQPVQDLKLYLLASAGFLLVIMLFTAIFTLAALRDEKNTQKRTKTVQKRTRSISSSKLSGRMKYAFLSFARGGMRTISICVLVCAAVLFFTALNASEMRYESNLRDVESHSVINGYATNSSGKNISGLVIRGDVAYGIASSKQVERCTFGTQVSHYRFRGITRTADGTEKTIDPFIPPASGFAIETLEAQLSREPVWMMTNRISGSPDFYFEESPEVAWLPGYSEADLSGTESNIAVLPRSMAEENGIGLGDTIEVLYMTSKQWGGTEFNTCLLRVAGIYTPVSTAETIYTPYADPFDGMVPEENLKRLSFQYLTFRLRDSAHLSEMRDVLQNAGFVPARTTGHVRNYAVLDDAAYISTTSSMQRQLHYISLLFGFLFALVLFAAVFASRLIAQSRKYETAVMRAIGAGNGVIFSMFLLEQVLLLVIGTLVGVILTVGVLHHEFTVKCMILTMLFVLLWLIGTASGILRQLKTGSLELLQEL